VSLWKLRFCQENSLPWPVFLLLWSCHQHQINYMKAQSFAIDVSRGDILQRVLLYSCTLRIVLLFARNVSTWISSNEATGGRWIPSVGRRQSPSRRLQSLRLRHSLHRDPGTFTRLGAWKRRHSRLLCAQQPHLSRHKPRTLFRALRIAIEGERSACIPFNRSCEDWASPRIGFRWFICLAMLNKMLAKMLYRTFKCVKIPLIRFFMPVSL